MILEKGFIDKAGSFEVFTVLTAKTVIIAAKSANAKLIIIFNAKFWLELSKGSLEEAVATFVEPSEMPKKFQEV